ncbi:MAG TPA: hypothetical protein VL157_09440 [Gemmatimonadaceae bacterium]|nr:hypothetical protein [Gemmatimonadaceae bacterium]
MNAGTISTLGTKETFVRHIGVVCVIALLVGCSGSTSVHPFGGAYDLISVDGQQVPQPFYPGVSTQELLGGTLTVGPDTQAVNLSLQSESGGQPTGNVVPMIVDFPCARLGDSLYFPSDTSLFHDPLYIGRPPPAFGAIAGSSVRITLAVYPPISTGLREIGRQFSCAPAP